MGKQFKRGYDLSIDHKGKRLVIKELRLVFEVTKSIRSFPNLAKIEVYNPAETTRAILQSKFTNIILNVGYAGARALIFKGDIRNTTQTKQGVDSIITLYAGDGQRDWESSHVNITFDKSVKIRDVIKKVAETFRRTSVAPITEFGNYSDRIRSQTLSGSTKDVLCTDGKGRYHGKNKSRNRNDRIPDRNG